MQPTGSGPEAKPRRERTNESLRMSLKLYFHPLSSFCHKALIALYENDTPFEPHIVDLADERSRTAFRRIWPIGKFPVLRDEAHDRTISESTMIIEYLAQRYPGRTELLPSDPDLALQTRMRDRFYDLYVNVPMQKIVTDRLRPPGRNDPQGVDEAKLMLQTACSLLDDEMATRTWAIGDAFSMADCAAAPALFYADTLDPFAGSYDHLAAYVRRLVARPSVARVLEEAQPYFKLFPMKRKPDIARFGAARPGRA
jgi:glutathione S-transferase